MKFNNDSDILKGEKFFLKPFTVKDIQKDYIDWLNDTIINQYLEIRFQKQTLKTQTELGATLNSNASDEPLGHRNNKENMRQKCF